MLKLVFQGKVEMVCGQEVTNITSKNGWSIFTKQIDSPDCLEVRIGKDGAILGHASLTTHRDETVEMSIEPKEEFKGSHMKC
jgi:hypothetical protein